MAFNGAGTFVINSVGNPVVTTTVISSAWANALTADLATGLTNTLTKDGQSTPTANIPLHSFKLTGLGAATLAGDALSWGAAANVSALTVGSLGGILFGTAGVVSATNALTGSATAPALIVTNIVEPETISATAATGTITIYPSTQSIVYFTTAASANFILNVAWSAGTTLNTALSTGQAVTVVFKNTNGAAAKYCTAIQVDGTTSGVTTKWQGTAPVAGDANSLDIYTLTITKTGSATFNVLASLTPYT